MLLHILRILEEIRLGRQIQNFKVVKAEDSYNVALSSLLVHLLSFVVTGYLDVVRTPKLRQGRE